MTLFPQLFNLLLIEYNIASERSVQLIIFLGNDCLSFPVLKDFLTRNTVKLELWLQLIFHLDGQGKL